MPAGGRIAASIDVAAVVSDSAAKMPPVWSQRTPELAEQVVPVDVAGPQLRRRRCGRGRDTPTAPRTPKPRSVKLRPLRTVAADAVVRHPADERGVDAALQDQVLDQPADLVVGERGDDGGAQAEAAAQPAGDVVLAAALPDLERAGGADPALARVEAQHHLAERDQVVAALLGGRTTGVTLPPSAPGSRDRRGGRGRAR